MGERVTHGTEAVAVELRAHILTVRENERGGAIPRLTLLRERRERTFDVARKQRVVLKCGRNERQHGLFGGESFEQLYFESVVEARGVADIRFQRLEPRANR